MRLTRRNVFQGVIGTGLALGIGPWPRRAAAQSGWSGGGVRTLGESLLGATKYAEGFPHFDYVNPDAPKGGTARLDRTGRFDSFNPFNVKGSAAAEVNLTFDRLMAPSLDEGSTQYGLLAEWMERPADDSWVAFRLRDGARFHDGRPVTVADVKQTFRLLREQGEPFYQFYYKDVAEPVDEGDNIVRFRFSVTGNKELPHIMGQLPVLAAHHWESRDFGEATLEPPLGSGPYRIGDFEPGRFVELERVPDYWGAMLPVNVGSHNFDRLRYEYFSDRDIAFEAFKTGQVDFWDENRARRWAQGFDFQAVTDGRVIKKEVDVQGPKTVQFFVLNTRKPIFADRRAREAFALAFDFEWSNERIFFQQYARPASYFQGQTDLAATTAPPDAAELALLEPFRDQLPEALFTGVFENAVTDGRGTPRRQLRRATRLLREAGFTVRDETLFLPDGSPAEVEFLSAQAAQQPLVQAFLKNLEVLGVKASFRFVDSSQYINRVRAYDFDMMISGLANSESPGNEQREFWGSASADRPGGRNLSGVKSPVVDALIEAIVFAENREALAAASRALDRVLLWEHYTVLELYQPFERVAHWDRFGAPDPLPPRSVGWPTVWWEDAGKAAALDQG